MNGRIFLAFFVAFVFGCSSDGGSGEGNPPSVENNAPSIPTLVFPSDNLLCIDNTLKFEWNASTDDDGDAITYKIEVSKDIQFSSLEKSASVSETTNTFTLEKGIAYYWRVQAVDSKNESSGFSSIFNLYTEGEGVLNYLPFAPELVRPSLGANVSGASVTLEWNGSDTDGDALTYDVYFGTDTPSNTLVSENQSETTYTANITSGTTYYWKIAVKDGNGGTTIGQVWSFKVE